MTEPFRFDEIAGSDAASLDPDPTRTAEVARDLQALARSVPGTAPAGFVDRVTAAIAAEPLPRPTGAAGVAARQGRPVAFLGAIRDIWRVALSGGRPLAVRAQAAALVVAIVVLVGSLGGLAAIEGTGLLRPGPGSTGAISPPLTSGMSSEPVPSATEVEPSGSPEPSGVPETAEPSGSPVESASTPAAGGPASQTPSRTPRPTDDSGGPTARPTTTALPSPTETPQPTETNQPFPTPSGSDDHGG